MKTPQTEEEALLILTLTPQLGTQRIHKLINFFGSALQILNAPLDMVQQHFDQTHAVANFWGWWEKKRNWRDEVLRIEDHQVLLLPFTSTYFPKLLKTIFDPPVLIYVKGTLPYPSDPYLSIVGTRNPSLYGIQQSQRFSRALASKEFAIVSGLARGIDTTVHTAALETGRTIAIIGSGLGNIYPKENRELSERISKQGAVISEYSMLAPPEKHHFPQRNRLVSGISLVTLLIEAPLNSGAMITMNKGIAQKRHLFTIPGPITLDSFRGNHHLIKKRKAHLVESPEEIPIFLKESQPQLPFVKNFLP